MRLLVCGDRHFNDRALMEEYLGRLAPSTVIHGNARGADSLAGHVALLMDIEVIVFPAEWAVFGRAAGPIRNQQMLDEGKPDRVLAFLAPGSKGTANMIKKAEKAGVPVTVVHVII